MIYFDYICDCSHLLDFVSTMSETERLPSLVVFLNTLIVHIRESRIIPGGYNFF